MALIDEDYMDTYHGKVRSLIRDNAGKLKWEQILAGQRQQIILQQDTVYSIHLAKQTTSIELAHALSKIDNKYHEWYAILYTRDSVPEITWSTVDIVNGKLYPNSVYFITIIGYMEDGTVANISPIYEDAPDIYLFDCQAADPYCSTNSDGWTISYHSNNGNLHTLNSENYLLYNTAAKAQEYSMLANREMDLDDLIDRGYTTIHLQPYDSTANSTIAYLIIGQQSKISGTNRGNTLGNYITQDQTPAKDQKELIGSLAAIRQAIGRKVYLGMLRNNNGSTTSTISGIKRCWLSKE